MEKKKYRFVISDLFRFIRVETCLFISGIALTGMLLFNPSEISWSEISELFFAVFFGCCVGYAYNHIMDKEEDKINNPRLNFFAENEKAGYLIMTLSSFIGVYFALGLTLLSFVIYLVSVVCVLPYSGLRLKGVFCLKNAYTGLMIALAFLVGACSTAVKLCEAIPFALLAFLFGFTGNLLGDIRGYKGDKRTGLKTIPVVIGVENSKRLVYLLILFMIILSLHLNPLFFLPLIPFLIMTGIFLRFEFHKGARYSILFSFAMLPFFHLMLSCVR